MLPSLDRSKLIASGWQQGVAIRGSDLPAEFEEEFYLVLTQDCDCINPDLAKEPTLELLPLTRSPDPSKPDPEIRDGINPRRIQFRALIDDRETLVESSIAEIKHLPRERQAELSLASELTLPSGTLPNLLVWRAGPLPAHPVFRFLRNGFPKGAFQIFQAHQTK